MINNPFLFDDRPLEPSNWLFAEYFDFRGGVNDSSSPDNLLGDELMKAENVDLSFRGGFKRRFGITEYANIGTDPITRLVELEYDDGYGPVLKRLALTGGKLMDIDTEEILRDGLGPHLDYVIYNNKAYILSSGYFMVYDGSTLEDVDREEEDNALDTIKNCRYIEQRGERLFAAGHPSHPNSLFYSEVGEPDYWRQINEVRAISDDADRITGLAEFHEALVVFKANHIYAWFGYDPSSDVEFHKLNVHTGTRAHRTIQRVNNMLVYLGGDGVYALLGLEKNYISSLKLSRTRNTKMAEIKHNTPHFENAACAVHHEGKYMLSVPIGDDPKENNWVFVLNSDLVNLEDGRASWVDYTGWNIADFLKSVDGNLYSASSVTGRIHKHEEVYNDLGEGIKIDVITQPISVGDRIHNKKFRRAYLALQQFEEYNTNLTVEAVVDYRRRFQELTADESLVWGMRNWGEAFWGFTDLVTRRFKVGAKGKRLVLRITDDTPDYALTVYGFGLEYKIKNPDRR